jgi:hypothetical protein
VILAFFMVPLIVWLADLEAKWKGEEFTYIWRFHNVLASLMAAMLGLNSFDKFTQAKTKVAEAQVTATVAVATAAGTANPGTPAAPAPAAGGPVR